jgi:D-3-phosphoglycerate dehydrogenase / 2-oxoglutarate reductase
MNATPTRRPRVVITDIVFDSTEPEREVLGNLAELELAPAADEQTLRQVAADADALLNCYAKLSPDLLRSLRRCRLIARYGIGVDTVPLSVASELGIMVTNVPDYCIDEVSDHALALLLNLARGIGRVSLATRAGDWDIGVVQPLYRLRGRTLAILGFGRIGRALADKARPLGLRLVAFDQYVPDDAIRAAGVEPVSLQEALKQADLVSVHVPLTDETHHLIDARALAWMKPGAFLVNTSRGPVVDTQALVDALRAGRLAGAGLDVIEPEPLPADHELRPMPNVVLTPHTAFYSEESQRELQRRAAEEVARVLRGEPPRSLVNAEALAALNPP